MAREFLQIALGKLTVLQMDLTDWQEMEGTEPVQKKAV